MRHLPKILYNVSFNTHKCDPVLTPKIPITAGYDEDETIPRVCLADSIEHCIQAIASQHRRLRVGTEIVIRSINTDQLNPILITTPNELFIQQLVPDAIENQEYWYEDEIMCNLAIEKIKYFDFYQDLAWSCIAIEYVQDIVQCYTEDINVNAFKTAKSLYNAFIEYAEQNERWQDIDDIWNDIATLTWSQKLVIEKIEFYSEIDLEKEFYAISV